LLSLEVFERNERNEKADFETGKISERVDWLGALRFPRPAAR
jgi:hypothetical protein